MRVVGATAAAVLAAVGAQPTSITMVSTLGSKIKMGGAVINSYCESDLQVGFVRAYVETDKTPAGVENDVFLVLQNVKATCAGNGGMAPCATGPGLDRFPSFVCKFTGPDGAVEASAKVQGLAIQDIRGGEIQGTEAVVKCAMPVRGNFDHSVTATLVYRRFDGSETAIPFTGVPGTDKIAISSTASPTEFPTSAPTKAPTTSPTLSPTTPPTTSGCHSERALNSYYRCKAEATPMMCLTADSLSHLRFEQRAPPAPKSRASSLWLFMLRKSRVRQQK